MDKLSVIKFSATWCHPCKMLAPRFKEIVAEYSDSINVKEIDVDDDDEGLTNKFNIHSVPTILILDGDTVLTRIVGNDPGKLEQELRLRINH